MRLRQVLIWWTVGALSGGEGDEKTWPDQMFHTQVFFLEEDNGGATRQVLSVSWTVETFYLWFS